MNASNLSPFYDKGYDVSGYGAFHRSNINGLICLLMLGKLDHISDIPDILSLAIGKIKKFKVMYPLEVVIRMLWLTRL